MPRSFQTSAASATSGKSSGNPKANRLKQRLEKIKQGRDNFGHPDNRTPKALRNAMKLAALVSDDPAHQDKILDAASSTMSWAQDFRPAVGWPLAARAAQYVIHFGQRHIPEQPSNGDCDKIIKATLRAIPALAGACCYEARKHGCKNGVQPDKFKINGHRLRNVLEEMSDRDVLTEHQQDQILAYVSHMMFGLQMLRELSKFPVGCKDEILTCIREHHYLQDFLFANGSSCKSKVWFKKPLSLAASVPS